MKAIRNVSKVVQHIGGYRVEPGAVVELPAQVSEALVRLGLFEVCERASLLAAEVRNIAYPWPQQEPWVQALNAEACGGEFPGPPAKAERAMSLAIFAPPINELNGGTQVIIRLAGYLAARGHKVVLTSPRVPFAHDALSPVQLRCSLPEESVDIALGTFWSTIPAVLRAKARARAVLLQSNEAAWLEPSHRDRDLARRLLALPDIHYVAINRHVADWCRDDTGTSVTHVLPGCGVDCLEFSPRVNDFVLRRRICGILRGAWFKNDGFLLEVARHLKAAEPRFTLAVASFQDFRVSEADERLVRPDRQSMALMYSRSDFYVSGSLIEGSPLPPLEAMACGCLPAVTSVGTSDYLRPGVNGLVVDPSDPAGAAEAILEVAADDERRVAMIRAALQTARNRPWNLFLRAAEEALTEIASMQVRS